MFFLKRWLFKSMELGLGLQPYFCLETEDPIFVNFQLRDAEVAEIQKSLPKGFSLQKLRFTASDEVAEYWLSYNLYRVRYPNPRLREIEKVRCEINTFVVDPSGRPGIYVFSGSPFVSREKRRSWIGSICDWAERLVICIYGCGRLTSLIYYLGENTLEIELDEERNRVSIRLPLNVPPLPKKKLSAEYLRFNDLSFFNDGSTYDRVYVNNAFVGAEFQGLSSPQVTGVRCAGPFFDRAPDWIYFHRGSISYLVGALNRTPLGNRS